MTRKIWIAGACILTVAAIAAALGWWWLGRPMYEPGQLAARADLEPPAQTPAQNDRWQVTPEIELAHFAVGTGRNVLVVHGGPGIPDETPYSGLADLTDRFSFHYYAQRGCGPSHAPDRPALVFKYIREYPTTGWGAWGSASNSPILNGSGVF